VVTVALARLDAVNPRINAVVRPLHETALAEAAAADQALARGAAVGPLHGVPVTTKVNVAQSMRLAVPVLGLPAVSVPSGVTAGLPMGVQITAGRFREDLCLESAAAIEARAPMATPIDPR
jgi:Asp-tRNA(Asn)/Glu-tRNA(Gln) amidotransferase A subunit family amidase